MWLRKFFIWPLGSPNYWTVQRCYCLKGSLHNNWTLQYLKNMVKICIFPLSFAATDTTQMGIFATQVIMIHPLGPGRCFSPLPLESHSMPQESPCFCPSHYCATTIQLTGYYCTLENAMLNSDCDRIKGGKFYFWNHRKPRAKERKLSLTNWAY